MVRAPETSWRKLALPPRHKLTNCLGSTSQEIQDEGQDQTSKGIVPSLIQTGEGFLLKFELGLSLSWLTLPRLVLGSACALVFSLVLVLAWLVLGCASASSVFVLVGTRRA